MLDKASVIIKLIKDGFTESSRINFNSLSSGTNWARINRLGATGGNP